MDGTPETVANPEWLTIGEAAQMLDISAKTVRRRIKDGTLAAEKRHDPEVGQERWYIDAGQIPRQPGTTGTMIPASVLEEVSRLHSQITEAVARAQVAETKADHERERRQRVEAEAEALRAELDAERNRRWWQRREK